MDFSEVIRNRYSVREYLDVPVEAEKLARVLEAARLAPSGSNRQPWRFVVVQDPQRRAAMAKACCDQAFLATAAVVIAGVGLQPDRVMRCQVPGDPVDLAIALEHIALAAVNEGLGTCWIGAFDQDAVRSVLGIPDTAKVIEVMALGYPADSLHPKTRKCMEEIVCHEQWRDKPLSL